MNRTEALARIREREKFWDFIVIGGGATGVGCCLDAASRGFDVLLLEQNDFGKGTSSRSTKLVHGGVRYLAQGDISLVREALKERGILLENAPHIVRKMAFVVPCYSLWDKFFYGAGLKMYDFLSGKHSFGKSRILSKKETIERLSNVKTESLRGGVVYFDGQFDDTRLLINLAQTASESGAALLNYARVSEITKGENGKIEGVKFQDAETGEFIEAKAKVVINATGAFSDFIRKLSDENSKNIIAPSQGIHLVFSKEFLPVETALMIPKTSDGRVLFAIPWHNQTLIGTTDTPIKKAELEPKALEKEIEFILKTAGNYLAKSPEREDILSVFVGIRPLVKNENTKNTASLSRDHTIEIDNANLLTITGGKWTTYRRMAEDVVNQAIKIAGLTEKSCVTENLKIHGADTTNIQKLIKENPVLAEKIHAGLSYQKAEIVRAIREEMAQTVEDILARRTRALFLNARAAIEIAPEIARIMADELGKDENWINRQIDEFNETARNYFIEE
ncbi:MAG: glycerol-3-phosphate dehydrogenase/oxidase [Pyrinomonadaceae bacterium]